MAIIYLSLEQAIEVHRKTVEVSGGGALGHLELGKLESVLDHIQNDDYYPTFEEKLTHLFFCACKFHCFQDGNKRIAISLVLKCCCSTVICIAQAGLSLKWKISATTLQREISIKACSVRLSQQYLTTAWIRKSLS